MPHSSPFPVQLIASYCCPLFSMASSFFLLFSMFAIFSLSTLPSHSISSNNVPEQQWLLGFKAGITLDPHHSLSNWNSHTPICNWTGITCTTPTHTIVALDLSLMSLEGTISPLLGNLSSLQSLNLSNNSLHGEIPTQLGQLSCLQILWLDSNQLQGSIPPELSLLTSLKYLHLGVNSLTGTIPSSLRNLSALVELYLGENYLEGPIPPDLGTLAQLQLLYLRFNRLSGTIPPSLGNLSDLKYLGLSYNHLHESIPPELGLLAQLKILYMRENNLTGNIPSSLGNLSALTNLSISENNLHGPIPVELGMLTQLQLLQLNSNKFSGTIPYSLTNLSTLKAFLLYENQLRGHIPWELCTKLTNLQFLVLGENDLTGNIPSSIENCSNLTFLALNMNQLSGVVPIELGKLKFLRRLYLYYNQLVGNTMAFFTALANCSQLEVLGLSHNYFTGVLPASGGRFSSRLNFLNLSYNMISGSILQLIANLTRLTYLNLGNNSFSGNIPRGIKRLHNLERLYLQGNRLEGSIPNEIGQIKSLGLLSLGRNELSGKIPDSVCGLQQLRYLSLEHNHLSGEIPASLEGCHNLELLDLSYNKLRGRIPRLVIASLSNLQFYLNLSGNFLQGSLPLEVSKIIMAQAIDISGNLLDGVIPNALGDCTALELLNLSHNAFEGSIPDTLSKLKNLQEIDLSFNNLSRKIPEQGLFPNITVIALLMGNPGLCGPQNYSLPACLTQSQRKHSVLKNRVLPAVGVISFILFSLILGIFWRRKFSRQLFRPSNFAFPRPSYPKFSYQDLVTATNGFDQENLLGVGNFGSVYKGISRDGRVVAIKALNLQNEEALKSFNTECKVLGKVRHRNLIRIISAFSYPGFIGLVLEFASNGSLEKHLHPDRDDEDCCELGLSECLNIAVDVAHGMEYLHYDCYMQVVHCDLKPSNVLLDSNMTALVTDFGISRLTTAPNSVDSINTATFALRGSIGYIAPEYGLGGRVSIEGDVYSYGILILEMVTRKRPSDEMFVGDMNLQKWVRSVFPERISDIVDGSLLRDVDANMEEKRCLLSFIEIGLLCSSETPRDRPSMRYIVRALEGLRASFMGTATASNLMSTISDLLHNTNPRRTATSASNSESSTF